MFLPSRQRALGLLTALLCTAITAGHAHADDTSNTSVDALLKAVNDQAQRLADDEKKLEDSRKALDDQQRKLLQEQVKFNELKAKVIAVTGKTIATPAAPQATTQAKPQQTATKTAEAETAAGSEPAAVVPPTPSAEQQASGPQEVGTEKKESAEKPVDITALTDQGGILLQKGQLMVTPTMEYLHSSATAVEVEGFSIIPAINVGYFEISQVDRDIYTESMDLLYGLTSRWEIETKIPYVERTDFTLSRPAGSGSSTDTLYTATGQDIGDIEFAAHYQMTTGQNGWPFLIANLRFKTATGTNPYDIPINSAGVYTSSPTGSGFYALQPSITAIYSSDPVVFYGNAGYLHNFERSFASTGELNPGDSVSASFGMSFALNDKASWSLGYSHTLVMRPTENGAPIPDTSLLQIGTLDLGYSYNLTDKTSLNFLVSAGVTSDAPNIHLTFRVPMTFDLLH